MAIRVLTGKQAKFVLYYVGKANGNATEAARLAGYAHPEAIASRLVRKSWISAKISERLDGASISANEILARLSDQATASVDDFIKEDADGKGFTLDLAKARRTGKMHCVKKIKHGAHGLEIELFDAQAALEKLGKYRGLWKDVSPPPGNVTFTINADGTPTPSGPPPESDPQP